MSRDTIIEMIKSISRIEGYVFATGKHVFAFEQIDYITENLTHELEVVDGVAMGELV
jgi:hypothetical protein